MLRPPIAILCLSLGLWAQTPSIPGLDPAWLGENQGIPVLEALKRPQVTEVREFKDWQWTQGHATYRMSGKAFLLTAQDQPIGFYFQGDGKIRYASKDPVEFKAMKYLLQRHTYAKPQESADTLQIEEPLDEGLFWFAGSPVPQIPGQPVATDPKGCQKRMASLLEGDQAPFLQELALRALKSTDQPYFRAQLFSRNRPWLHVVDPLDSESLSVAMKRVQALGYQRTWVQLSQQAMGWTHAQPKQPRFALTHVDVSVEATKTTAAKITVTETLLPKVSGLTALDLRLRNRLAGMSLTHNERIQRIRVQKVLDERGAPLPFDHANEGLLVQIPDLKANTPVKVTVELEGEQLEYPHEENKYVGWCLRGPWLPLPKDPAADVYTLHATVKAPKETTPILGGQSLRREVKEGWNIVETRFDQPIHNFGILGIGLPSQEETRNGITLRTIGWAQSNLDRQLLDPAWSMLSGFQQLLGTLPFKEFNLVVDNGVYDDLPGIISVWRTSRGYSSEVIARGFARQYWNQVAKPWSQEDAWISQAFPQFCTSLLFRVAGGAQGQATYERIADDWFLRAQKTKDVGSLAMASRIVPEEDNPLEAEQQMNLGTHRGSCLLYNLHQQLGDQNTIQFLRDVLAQASYQPVSTAQFPALLKPLGPQDFQSLFDRCFWGSTLPDRKAAH